MAIVLNDNVRVGAGKPSEPKYLNLSNAPYTGTSQVFSQIPLGERHPGLTVLLEGSPKNIEYWFNTGVTNSALEIKTSSGGTSNITANNGLTKSGNNVRLGGTLTGDTLIALGAANASITFSGSSNNAITFARFNGGLYFNDNTGGGVYFNDTDGGGVYINGQNGGGGFSVQQDGGGIYFDESGGGGMYFNDGGGGGFGVNSSAGVVDFTIQNNGSFSTYVYTGDTSSKYAGFGYNAGDIEHAVGDPSAGWLGKFGVGSDGWATGKNVYLQAYNTTAATNTQLLMSIGKIEFVSTVPNFSGASYAADYSANYTDRSLVDKAWVLSQMGGTGSTGSTNAGNGLNKLGNTIRLGGEITGATTISGVTGTSLYFGINGGVLAEFSQHDGGFDIIASYDNYDKNTKISLDGQNVNLESSSGDIGAQIIIENGTGDSVAGIYMLVANNNEIAPNGLLTINTGETTIQRFAEGSGYTTNLQQIYYPGSGLRTQITSNDNITGKYSSFIVNSTPVDGMEEGASLFAYDLDEYSYVRSHGYVETMAQDAITSDIVRLKISTKPNQTFFEDSRSGSTRVGLEYAADYSANYTDRSLVDKAWVLSQMGGTGNTGSTYASNGLTKQGNTIVLGGELTGETTIDLSANTLNFITSDQNGGFWVANENSESIYRTRSLVVDSFSVGFQSGSGTTNSTLELIDDGIRISLGGDVGTQNALYYDDDYSIYFGPRSIPDVEWVLSQITGGTGSTSSITASNGLTKVTDDIQLGGSGDDAYVFMTGSTFHLANRNDAGSSLILGSSSDAQYGTFLFMAQLGSETPIYDVGLKLSPTSAVFADNRGTPVGLEYENDYSANYTDRSLVDKAWVLAQTGGGNFWPLSGSASLTDNVIITAPDGHGLNLGGTYTYTPPNGLGRIGTQLAHFQLNAGVTEFFTNEGQGLSMYVVNQDAGIVKGLINLDGSNDDLGEEFAGSGMWTFDRTMAQYAGDYSAFYTDRSLVDKAYVDSVVGGSGSTTINFVAIDIDTTIANTVDVVLVDTTSPVIVTLPTTPNPNKKIIIKDRTGNALTNNITIDGNSRNIDGDTTTSINTNRGAIELVYSVDFDEYYVVGFVN